CNALQCVLGIFLHSCNAPEAVCELMSCIGLSISMTSINHAVNYLSHEANKEMHKLGQTFLTAYAYDNLDIDLKHTVPTAEKTHDTLVHLTTGTLIPLHEVTLGDLDCSEELWKSSLNNRSKDAENFTVPFGRLIEWHSQFDKPHSSGLTLRERFNKWKFLFDITHSGPEYFHRFRYTLKDPEVIEATPLKKTQQVPLGRCRRPKQWLCQGRLRLRRR
ncbi:hypothetical protein BDQ17DRAFT_1241875, partial [Cyathus striatus]